MKTHKIRFAEKLGHHVVTVEGCKVVVHCIGWNNIEVTPLKGEDVQALRSRIVKLIKGTPCGIEDVRTLLEIAL